jgi:hypothetical protein
VPSISAAEIALPFDTVIESGQQFTASVAPVSSPVSFKRTVQAGRVEVLLSVTCNIAADGVVSTRVPELSYLDGDGNTMARMFANGSFAAGQQALCTWSLAIGAGSSVTATSGGVTFLLCMIPLTGLALVSGYSWLVSGAGMDSGDVLNSLSFVVAQYTVGRWGAAQQEAPVPVPHPIAFETAAGTPTFQVVTGGGVDTGSESNGGGPSLPGDTGGDTGLPSGDVTPPPDEGPFPAGGSDTTQPPPPPQPPPAVPPSTNPNILPPGPVADTGPTAPPPAPEPSPIGHGAVDQ